MTREEINKAVRDKTWLVFDNTVLVQVVLDDGLGYWVVSDGTFARRDNLRIATAKDLVELE